MKVETYALVTNANLPSGFFLKALPITQFITLLIIAEAKKESEDIIRAAEDRKKSMIEQSEVMREAKAEAGELLNDAKVKASEIRKAANDYVENVMKRTDDAITAQLTELRKTRQNLRITKKQ